MTNTQIIFAVLSLVIPVMMALILLINKLYNNRVDTLDKRECENNARHLMNHQRIADTITEERRLSEERATRIFDKLDRATEKISEINASIISNFVSKDDCGRCKDG